MKKLLVLVMVIGLIASCGKGDEGGETVSDDTAAVVEQTPESRPGIPDQSVSGYETAAEAVIRPSFDKKGKQTSKEVTPGEMFDLYVIAEFNDAFSMSGAEYKLVVPEGITVLGAAYMDSVNVSLGKYDVDISLAFPTCIPGPGDWLTKYLCKAEDDFTGGKFETLPGERLGFIGFVMCDHLATQIRAAGGTAEMGRK